jgi:hypothetical protein
MTSRILRTLALALSVTACIPLVPRSSTSSSGGAGDPSGTPPPSSTASSPSGASSSEPTAPAPAPAGPQTVSVTIRSSCGQTVKVFYGDNPGFSSGTTSSISSNSVQSKTFQVGDQMWVLDGAGKGAGSVTIGSGTRNVEIASSCASIAAR